MNPTICPGLSAGIASEYRGYILVMRATRDEALTLREVAAKTGMLPKALHHILPAMRASGLIGIKDWKVVERQSSPLYGWGADEAARLPVLGKPKARVIVFANILKTLRDPSTAGEIMAQTGLSQGAVLRCLRILKIHRLAYICAWRSTGAQNYVGVWRLGSQSNAARPAREDKRVINARAWAKRAQRRAEGKVMREQFAQVVSVDPMQLAVRALAPALEAA